jgi:DNA-binding beta-propeller fold protein YncE
VSLVDTATEREVGQIAVCRGPVDVTASSADSGVAFVSCYSSGFVGVLDLHRGRQIQEIAVGDKPFGIAAGSADKRIFVCVGGSNRLVVLDGKIPSRILRRIALPGTPLQLAIAP